MLRELGTRPICPEMKMRPSTWIWIDKSVNGGSASGNLRSGGSLIPKTYDYGLRVRADICWCPVA